ncbi:hypothetical protein HAX54_010353 [Datura stramonium]|uniref:Uncharacterized protein n=1 Tax=Datura stramonium TaxID=4076 RepID=A0ABS8RWY8_DATST|nr:hypothetical protein [Datura stramonium]
MEENYRLLDKHGSKVDEPSNTCRGIIRGIRCDHNNMAFWIREMCYFSHGINGEGKSEYPPLLGTKG